MSFDVSAGGAFVAGLLSFASPCVLPLVPPYLAYIGGVSIEQLREQGAAKARVQVLLAALCFVAGFSTVFVALGATASWIGQAVSSHLGILGYVAGALIVLMACISSMWFGSLCWIAPCVSAWRKNPPV